MPKFSIHFSASLDNILQMVGVIWFVFSHIYNFQAFRSSKTITI